MNIKKFGIITVSCLAVVYGLFLIVPFFLTGVVNSYNDEISKMIEESSGFKVELQNIRVVTTPKLTAGVRAGEVRVKQPDNEEILSLNNAEAKLALLPLFVRRIQADVVKADSVKVLLKVKKDGHLLVEDYIPAQEDETATPAMTGLPYGFKLSNQLPDIRIKTYNFALSDMRNNKTYSLYGNDFNITDFIFNKKVKISAKGGVDFDGTNPFNYNIKVFNRVMPDMTLDELVFGQGSSEDVTPEEVQPLAFNFLEIFEGIKKNQLCANLFVDIKTSGKPADVKVDGLIDLENLTLAVNSKKLPEGHVKLKFQGKKLVPDVVLYTAENEQTSVAGEIKPRKFNLAFKSNAQINNIFNIIKSVASSFGYNDLASLTATGAIDADFSFKSNMKKIVSDGYFKIPSASVKYSLYNIFIDKINADVNFGGDELNVKNAGFMILNQPLKAYGTIKENTATDLHLIADKLSVKGLVAAAGQMNLLKENDIKSGTLSANASLTGTFKELQPDLNLTVDNIDILNKPSAIEVKLPKAALNLNPKDVNIDDTYMLLDNSRIDISGKISDYATKKLLVDIQAKGNLVSNDIKNMLPANMRPLVTARGAMPVLVTITGNDKKQIVEARLQATPNGYFKLVDVDALSGKNTLIRSTVMIVDNSLKFSDSGIYVDGSVPVSLVSLKGGIDNLSDPKLNNLNIATNSVQTISIPGFKNSKAKVNANIVLNGNVAAPVMKGKVTLPEVNIPSMKTVLKNIDVALGSNSIDVNLPYIMADKSSMNAKASVSPNFAKGVVVKSVDFKGDYIDADSLAAVAAGTSSSGSSSTVSSAAPADLGIVVQHGKGVVNKFKTGNIIASNLTSDFGLKNNVFYLKNLKGNAFSGTINGDINVNVLNGKTAVKLNGAGMNAVDAIDASAGIPNALSGVLGFKTDLKLNAFAPSYNDMLKSISGDISFDVKDGHYANIGRLDNLLLAQNLAANVILKAALAPVRNMPVVQNTSGFKAITGTLTLHNGTANLKSVKSAGPSMAYFVKGNYDLLSGYTNVIILGRLGADVVAALGPFGQLSASKLTSFIPKFGAQTANIINALTSNPLTENTAQIPALTNGNSNTKDFKVVFRGNVTSPASIKSFKWLTTCDTSQITGGSFKDQLKTSTDTLKNSGKASIQDVKKSVENVKDSAKTTAEDIKNQVQRTKDSIKDLKNLKNIFKAPAAE